MFRGQLRRLLQLLGLGRQQQAAGDLHPMHISTHDTLNLCASNKSVLNFLAELGLHLIDSELVSGNVCYGALCQQLASIPICCEAFPLPEPTAQLSE